MHVQYMSNVFCSGVECLYLAQHTCTDSDPQNTNIQQNIKGKGVP